MPPQLLDGMGTCAQIDATPSIGRYLMTWDSQPKEFQDKSSSVRLQQGLARYKAKSGTWC